MNQHPIKKGNNNNQDLQSLYSKLVYNHPHFSHILVRVTQFLVTIHFNKKHHSLKSLS
jgi:hypothetical protein